jgi:hypothetical protein
MGGLYGLYPSRCCCGVCHKTASYSIVAVCQSFKQEDTFFLRIQVYIFKASSHWYLHIQTNKQTNSVALSPQANYTDRTTATCWRNVVSTFADRGVSCFQRGGSPTVVNLSPPDRAHSGTALNWFRKQIIEHDEERYRQHLKKKYLRFWRHWLWRKTSPEMMPCGSCLNLSFGVTCCLHLRGRRNRRDSNNVSSN